MRFKEFLNPKSMLTPAIAGSFIMIIANTLWVQFALPPKWSALFLSFLFLVPVLKDYIASILEKIIYFFFNGLIVFSLSINTNFAAGKILSNETVDIPKNSISALLIHDDDFIPFINNAYAEDSSRTSTVITTTTKKVTKKIESTTGERDSDKKSPNSTDTKSKERKFFQPWLN